MRRIGAVLLALGAAAAIMSSTAALSEDALERAISLATGERYGEARRTLDPLLQRDPGSPRGRLLHGILRLHEGESDEAAGIFRQLVRDAPDLFEAYNNLAVLYAAEGRLDDARGVLLGILDRRPEAVGYRNLGDVYVSLARDAYARARELGWDGTVPGQDIGEPDRPPRKPPATQGTTAQASTPEAYAPAEAGVPTDPIDLLAKPSAAAADGNASCLLAAEFNVPAGAEDAARWLRVQGAESVRVSRGTREKIESYRVYIPPFQDRSGAAGKVRELRGRGVVDVAVILRGALKNAVSLGVYANEANAERRASELGKLGYAVVLEAHAKSVEEYAAIEARFAGTPEELGEAWSSQYPGHAIRHVDCA